MPQTPPYSMYPLTRAKSRVKKTKKMIRKIKEHPALYDPTHPDFSNPGVTEPIWNTIAVECERNSAEEIKTKWNTLKNSFIKEQCRDILVQIGTANPRKGKWRYQTIMDYFHPFWKEEEMTLIRSNQNYVNSMREEDESRKEEEPTAENQTGMSFHDTLFAYYKKQEDGEWEDDEKVLLPSTEDQVSALNCSVTCQQDDQLNISSKKLDYSKPKTNSQGEDETLYHFFMSMYNSTIALPTMLQLRVKRQMFSALAEIEEKLYKI